MDFPEEPYGARGDVPVVSPARPTSQGDVFIDLPLVGAAQPNPKQAGSWVATKPRKSLGILVTHPCGSRSSTTHRLNPFLSIAPVVKCPPEWEAPWEGHFSLMPLPGLLNGEDYVAKLNEVCPVSRDALVDRRIAHLSADGLKALFHRLAMNSLRYPETPVHYATEAQRLADEIDLWETWTMRNGSEDGYQDWLDEAFGGQPIEGGNGTLVEGSAVVSGQSRRAVLLWNREEVEAELQAS